MPEQIELHTTHGLLVVERVDGPMRFPGYKLTTRDHRDHTETTAEFETEAMARLVEFVGYPRETSERADRLQEELDALTVELEQAQTARRVMEIQLDQLRGLAAVLIRNLSGAWWLEAAEAYTQIKNILVTGTP